MFDRPGAVGATFSVFIDPKGCLSEGDFFLLFFFVPPVVGCFARFLGTDFSDVENEEKAVAWK